MICQWPACRKRAPGKARYCSQTHRQYAYLARKAAKQGLPASPAGYVRLAALRGSEAHWAGGWWPPFR